MKSSHQKLDFHTLSVEMLQEKREAYIRLRARGSSLPDGGEKLDTAIELINSILERKKNQPSPRSQRIPAFETLRESIFPPVNLKTTSEESSESVDEEIVDITLGLNSIDIRDDGFEDGGEEDLSSISNDPLTPQEIDLYLSLCKLPPIRYSDMTPCHPFVVYIGFIPSNYIYLRVIDCLEMENTFSKYGTQITWNFASKSQENVESSMDHKPTISHPGSAISDLWDFVNKAIKRSKNWPVFLFESEGSLKTFRTLYCNTSVQHYPGAKNLPTTIRFAVHVSPVGDPSLEENGSSGDVTLLDDRLAALAETYSKETMTSMSLKTMKPKSAVWLGAPLNYRALLRISKTPTNGVVAKLSDNLAKIQISSSDKPHEPRATSAPILNAIDDSLLRQLALSGFMPRTLALLAAKGGWRGFAGLLSALGISKGSPEPLSELYRCFMKVNRGLALNADLYKEGAKKASIKNLYSESERKTKTLLKPPPLCYQPPECKIRINMPPAADELLKYRENATFDSDDNSDSETEEEQS